MTRFLTRCACASFALVLSATAAQGSSYLPGVASNCAGCTFGTHLPQGPSGSIPGVGGGGIDPLAGTLLDGRRTYMWDAGGWIDGTVTRGDPDFAMLVWDMGTAFDTLRLYPHQDHYFGGPITDPNVAQDVMEYSIWASNDNLTFVLLSDAVGIDMNGGGAGMPTFTFAGSAPTFIYRGGSAAHGTVNAYTRDYTFGTSYRYYGVRPSTLAFAAFDPDPEIDAIAANAGPVAEPALVSLVLLGAGLVGRRRLRRRCSGRAGQD